MVSRFLILAALVAATAALAAPKDDVVLGEEAAGGWALFKRPWISEPSSLSAGGGVGPLYDARSCDSCHMGGGPGRVGVDALGSGMAIRVGRSDAKGDPVYGTQIQLLARPGYEPEARAAFHWDDKTPRAPTIDFAQMNYGPLAPGSHAALRRAPSLFGIGRLEAIPESEIVAQAKRSGGRPALLGDDRLGRFGWKAAESQLPSQIEVAFQRDFGISTGGHPGPYGECTEAQTLCRAVGGKDPELPDQFRDLLATFLRLLRAPEGLDEKAPGFAVFRDAGCLSCHAIMKDTKGMPVHAYTDLSLHDLGAGLDDGIAEGVAKSSEWRTAPLWNVSGELAQGGLLHDGRARDVAEAVQWHGGEASRARAAFNALSLKKRKLLDDFLLGR
jgi:CxxC motif-containing protein (DUF1111 family)